jgi:hypothetical protein
VSAWLDQPKPQTAHVHQLSPVHKLPQRRPPRSCRRAMGASHPRVPGGAQAL